MIVGNLNPVVLAKLFLAEPETILLDQFYEMMLSGDPITIWSTKVDGTPMRRVLQAGPGPSGNVKYDYEALGYMILEYGNEWRTIDVYSVTKCRYQGKTYYIK